MKKRDYVKKGMEVRRGTKNVGNKKKRQRIRSEKRTWKKQDPMKERG